MVINKLKKAIPKSKDDYVVALDIGTEFVKALIGKVVSSPDKPNEGQIEIVGVGKKHQSLQDMHSGAVADISGVVENCDAALTEAEEMAGITARKAVIGVAGELVKGETTTIKYRRQNPDKPLEEKELEQILKQVQERALARAQAQLAWESGQSGIEVKMVNSSVVNVHIDGYKVTNPVGFQGREVDIQLFCAFAPMVHIGAIERIALDLDLELLSVVAEPFAVAKSVGVEDSENFSAIFIDVGGGTSDIAVVSEGGVEGTKMFGIGGRSFTKAIAKKTNVSFAEAEKEKLSLSKDPRAHKAAHEAIMPTVKVWLSGVELALSEFEDVDQMPSKVLLCGGGTGLVHIKKALETQPWRKNLPFAKDLTIEHITPKQVHRVVDKTGKVEDYSFITPMGLLNQGLDIVSSFETNLGIMDRINRTLRA